MSGFQLAVMNGPLCEEPMSEVAFVVESLEIVADCASDSEGAVLAGQLISGSRDVCRNAALACGTRLMEPVYACELQATQVRLRFDV